MPRTTKYLVLVLASVLAFAGVARAVTNGEPDAGAHPYVGLVGFYDASGTYVQRCSGTLIRPKLFLTAAHCAFTEEGHPLKEARVWFDEAIGDGVVSGKVLGTPGVATAHPKFDNFASLPDTNDIAVVELSSAPIVSRLAGLAPVGALDELKKKDAWFTLVGYGNITKKETGDRTRRKATAKMGALNGKKTAGFNLKTKPGKNGGTFCFGDSGGPAMLDETDVVVALNSLVKANCKGAALSFRVDTQAAQDFLAPFLTSG